MLEKLKGLRFGEALLAVAAVAACALLLGRVGGGETDIEARMEAVLSQVEGAGRVRVLVSRSENGRAAGAVIVAEGADSVRVMLELQRAATALLDLEPEAVEVLGMREGRP